MAWEFLPETRADAPSAFFDADGAVRWLAGLPRANLDATLFALGQEVPALNRRQWSARERFKTLEVLRRAILDVSAEARKRYEYKPLPLPEGAAATLAVVRQVWRALAVGYLHCLQAVLQGDPGLLAHGVRTSHRVLACLRQEQWHGDLARHVPEDGFWRLAHAALACAQQMGLAREVLEDRLLGEARVSSVSGQYGMLHLLDLARPAALSRTQYAAAVRWLARWREQVEIGDAAGKYALAVDLNRDQARMEPKTDQASVCWLNLGKVLRKLRKRREALAEGASPESLKLGDTLSPTACDELLVALAERLQGPSALVASGGQTVVTVNVVVGIERIFHWLGGRGLYDDRQATTMSLVSHLRHERFAIFGHAGETASAASGVACEEWHLLAHDERGVRLVRPVGASSARLSLRGLLAFASVPGGPRELLDVQAISVLADGALWIEARFLPGRAQPVLAAVRDKQSGRYARHPAFSLADFPGRTPSLAVVPAGLSQRSVTLELLDLSGAVLPYSLAALSRRADEHEIWGVAAG